MRQFRFRLQSLLEVRRRKEDLARQDLARQERRTADLKARRISLERAIGAQRSRLVFPRGSRLDLVDIEQDRRRLRQLELELHEKIQAIAQASKELERSKEVVIQRTRDREMVEKLKERDFSRWQKEMARLDQVALDEIGYLFFPARHGYSFERYLEGFRRKSLKHLLEEPELLYERGAAFRYDFRPDIEQLYRLNLAAFGEDSYFHDPRFLEGFERLIAELDRRGRLRVVTVVIGGEIAAVDVGAVWNNRYTVLAGGTNRVFPGVAKLINFHHLRMACRERFDVVDFLCGDFGWKRRFHLAERPLFQIELARSCREESRIGSTADCPRERPAYA